MIVNSHADIEILFCQLEEEFYQTTLGQIIKFSLKKADKGDKNSDYGIVANLLNNLFSSMKKNEFKPEKLTNDEKLFKNMVDEVLESSTINNDKSNLKEQIKNLIPHCKAYQFLNQILFQNSLTPESIRRQPNGIFYIQGYEPLRRLLNRNWPFEINKNLIELILSTLKELLQENQAGNYFIIFSVEEQLLRRLLQEICCNDTKEKMRLLFSHMNDFLTGKEKNYASLF